MVDLDHVPAPLGPLLLVVDGGDGRGPDAIAECDEGNNEVTFDATCK